MSLGYIVRIVESIVTIGCGIILAVRPFTFRWNKSVVKMLFVILALLAVLVDVGNLRFAKFSAIGYSIIGGYLFIICLIFFRNKFFRMFAQFWIYWINLKILHYFPLYVSSRRNGVSFYTYIEQRYEIPWDLFHIISMLVIVMLSISIVAILRGRALLTCQKRWGYVFFSFLVLLEFLIDKTIFANEYSYDFISLNMLTVWGLVSLLLLCVGLSVGIFKCYINACNQERMLEMNYEMVNKQHNILMDVYKERKRQMHDEKHLNLLLLGYLEQGDIEMAKVYLTDHLGTSSVQTNNIYTGFFEIDYLLEHKIREASKYGIKFEGLFDVYFCSFSPKDIGIILGNLLDNAIEATKEIQNDYKIIHLKIKTVNEMFILEIRNKYEGLRKMIGGKYVTTKEDKSIHGMGLTSVEKIVEQNGGIFEINDIDNIFSVSVYCQKTVKN